MSKTTRYMRKEYGINRSEFRSLRHTGEMLAKEMKRDADRAKSKHTIEKRWNKGHKAWSIDSEAGKEIQ